MIAIALRFPAGRFHATPWDHHVNEGVPEWPPAPWRILRALYAMRCERCPEVDRTAALRALQKLSSAPRYHLPPAATGHSRHYLSLNQADRQKTALTFDTFVALPRDQPVYVTWDTALDEQEAQALRSLTKALSYLGRAESPCDAEVLTAPPTAEADCEPSDGRARPGWTTVRLLCPAEDFREQDLRRTTDELQREGWSDPPGTRWVLYRRRQDEQRGVRGTRRGPMMSQIAEFALGGPVLPLVTDTVRVADAFRRAALSLHGTPSVTLSGKGADGAPLQLRHAHAHYLPEARGSDPRRISHVVVFAPCGFTDQEEAALARISFLPRSLLEAELPQRSARGSEGLAAAVTTQRAPAQRDSMDLDVVLCGLASQAELAQSADQRTQQQGQPLASLLFGEARIWRSRTPFVLPRHPRRGQDDPEAQLRRELALRGLPHEPGDVALERLGAPAAGGLWSQFRTRRPRDSHHTGAFGALLRFQQPLRGPLLLGYGSHYGLGQFEPVPDLRSADVQAL